MQWPFSLAVHRSHMIYLVGVDHQVQYNSGSMSQERKSEILKFTQFIELKSKELKISMLAEEFNDEAVRRNRASSSILQEIAQRFGFKHAFCDPTTAERKELDIGDDKDLREQFWVSRLDSYLESENILLVCGASHLESFKTKLDAKGIRVEILPETFGMGLPAPVVTYGTEGIIDELGQ